MGDPLKEVIFPPIPGDPDPFGPGPPEGTPQPTPKD